MDQKYIVKNGYEVGMGLVNWKEIMKDKYEQSFVIFGNREQQFQKVFFGLIESMMKFMESEEDVMGKKIYMGRLMVFKN